MAKYLTNLTPIDRLGEDASDDLWSQPIRRLNVIKGICGDKVTYTYIVKRDDIEGEFIAKVFQLNVADNAKGAVIDEARITRKLQHKHVLRCIGVYEYQCSKDHVRVIIFELAEGGTLFQRLRSVKTFSEKDAAHIIRQIAEALEHIHGKNVLHRNVRPENIYFKDSPSGHSSENAILLANFRLACESEEKIAQGQVGSLAYIAPEAVCGAVYTEKVDMWALGVITYELLTGVKPFSGKNNGETEMQIMRKPIGHMLEMLQGISHEAKDFITKCLNRVPTERMSAKDALKHEWLRKHTNTSTAKIEHGSQSSSKAEGSNTISSPVTNRRGKGETNQPLASATRSSPSPKRNTTPDPVPATTTSKDTKKRSRDGKKPKQKKRKGNESEK